jgi:hypothetical protein
MMEPRTSRRQFIVAEADLLPVDAEESHGLDGAL